MSPNADKVRHILLDSLYAVMNGTKSVDGALSDGQRDMTVAINAASASSEVADDEAKPATPPSSGTMSVASISALLIFAFASFAL